MKSFNERLGGLLKSDSRFVDDKSSLIKNQVVTGALKFDEGLIGLLLSDGECKKKFFPEVRESLIFDVNGFVDYVQDKNFLSDSYTKFKNKIGLNVGGKFFNERNEVSLVWPFKDCVLEGDQTKEDHKRNEIFFNEVLAKDEIDRLLEPKVLTGFEFCKKDPKFPPPTTNQNLIIKGNNLLVLHSLKKKFQNKVKLIYIDPPYNTGNDTFTYNDNFNHSSWLTFIKNRLEVAKNLLRDDGVIFISCDDNEQAYLKVLCDEIFGRENFIANLIWEKVKIRKNSAKYFSESHEHVLVFARNKEKWNRNLIERKDTKGYKNPDNDKRGEWIPIPIHANHRYEVDYKITKPNGVILSRPKNNWWRLSEENFKKHVEENRIWWGKGESYPMIKKFLSEVQQGLVPKTILYYDEVGGGPHGDKILKDYFEGEKVFENPKSVGLIQHLLKIGTSPSSDDIILDFFAGSGTTGHAVLKQNKEDGGNRRFILVEQLDEHVEICRERIQKVLEKENIDDCFVYFELMKYNESAIDKIYGVEDSKELLEVWGEMCSKYFLNYNVRIKAFNDNKDDFENLEIEEQKKVLIEMLNKNQLYVNFSEIGDSQFKISEEDKRLNKEFYNVVF